MLLVGVIVNAIVGALYLLLYQLNLRWDITTQTGGAFRLLIGGIQTNLTGAQEFSAAACVAVGWVVLASLAGQLAAAPLGDAEAEALGVRIHRLRWVAMIAASLVTASAVAISGPIGFVGLICPHMARRFVGNDPRPLLPVSTALGAMLLAGADAVSRLLGRQNLVGAYLPVGVLTGLLGGPFFLLLLWRRQREA
jgi:iron complex transport system permease protein